MWLKEWEREEAFGRRLAAAAHTQPPARADVVWGQSSGLSRYFLLQRQSLSTGFPSPLSNLFNVIFIRFSTTFDSPKIIIMLSK